jgi:probable HAF family extracellular repeat protein
VNSLGSLGSGYTTGAAINDAGAVVGLSGGRAFLYTDTEGIVDLNGRVIYASGWVLQSASDINNAGQIIGTGLHNGKTRAYRLTPVPVRHGPPTSVTTYP